ncbi:MAG: NUDIX domain-containing protein, partial [Wenzhouxiangellaceae bacterium]
LSETYPAPRPVRHVFSHFALHMRFEHGRLESLPAEVADDDALRWFERAEALAAGLPRPVRAVLTRI